MKKQLILLLMLFFCHSATYASENIDFISNNLTEVKRRATTEGKLYFVHFMANWCMPCQWMESNTFKDQSLADYVADHYIAGKMDVDAAEVRAHKEAFQVKALPTLLIFNTQGVLLTRLEASLSATELLELLLLYNTPENRGKQATYTVFAVANTGDADKISRPALIPDEVSSGKKLPAEKKKYETTNPAAKPATTTTPIQSASLPMYRYRIQVGVFAEKANAQRQSERMKTAFGKTTTILEDIQKEKILYKVFVGNFESEAEANQYLLYLNKQEVKGFVKSIEN